MRCRAAIPRVEPPFSFPPLRIALPRHHSRALRPRRSGAQVRRGLADGRRGGIPGAADCDQVGRADRDAAAKFGNRAVVASATQAAAERRQSRQRASAPTMLSNQIDTQCPRCGRNIPVDSNYCSFCAADVTGTIVGARSRRDARGADDHARRRRFASRISGSDLSRASAPPASRANAGAGGWRIFSCWDT